MGRYEVAALSSPARVADIKEIFRHDGACSRRALTDGLETAPLAPENGRFPAELRELHFRVRQRTTHRIIFTVADDVVLVLAVRHVAQDELQSDDLV